MMRAMISAMVKSFRQLTDPRLNWVVLVSLAGAIAAFAGLWYGISWLIESSEFLQDSWFDFLAGWLSGAATFLLAIFLFPAVVTLIAGALLDYVVAAVEARHYPGLPPPRDMRIAEIVFYVVKFTLLVLGLNLLALPLYLVPGLNLVVFWVLNGYLLGREYFEIVALRRLGQEQARSLRRANGGRVFLAGLLVAVLMTLPVLNLLMPVVGAAFLTHVFHGLSRRGAA